jgi:hypothetical protein
MPSRSPSAGIRRASSFVNRDDQPIEGKVAFEAAQVAPADQIPAAEFLDQRNDFLKLGTVIAQLNSTFRRSAHSRPMYLPHEARRHIPWTGLIPPERPF